VKNPSLAWLAAIPAFCGVTAEFQVRSVSAGGETFITPDYLVVEVTVTPPDRREIVVSHSQFTLRMNSKKQLLFPQAPAFVAASLRHPDWEMRPNVMAQAGPVILGRPQVTERFPGDPVPAQGRLPRPPQAPAPEDRSGIEKERKRPEEAVVEAALPEGPAALPVKGYLYFAHRGAIKKIKSLELIYRGPAGDMNIKLR
jgi:hypothetical protein